MQLVHTNSIGKPDIPCFGPDSYMNVLFQNDPLKSWLNLYLGWFDIKFLVQTLFWPCFSQQICMSPRGLNGFTDAIDYYFAIINLSSSNFTNSSFISSRFFLPIVYQKEEYVSLYVFLTRHHYMGKTEILCEAFSTSITI